MVAKSSTTKETSPKTLVELYAVYPIRPIYGRIELGNAIKVVNRLAVLNRRTKDQEDYLELLSLAIEKYETDSHVLDTRNLNPIDTLKMLMDGHDMTASDLGQLLGNRSLGSKILRGERDISKAHIVKLSRHFGVGVGVFINS